MCMTGQSRVPDHRKKISVSADKKNLSKTRMIKKVEIYKYIWNTFLKKSGSNEQ